MCDEISRPLHEGIGQELTVVGWELDEIRDATTLPLLRASMLPMTMSFLWPETRPDLPARCASMVGDEGLEPSAFPV